MILISGADQNPDLSGIAMTQAAAVHFLGDFGGYFIAIVILLFAFTTIVASYSYAESAMVYLGQSAPNRLIYLRVGVMIFVVESPTR